MATAIIGIGNIGKAVATHLTEGGETVVLAASDEAKAQRRAEDLGQGASAASVADAIDQADAVIFAVWLDVTKELIADHGARLAGKVVIDPSNPITVAADGTYPRTLPDGVSSASVVNDLLPEGAHFVKAFGALSADALADSANRTPERAVLFYATDDDLAAATAERLISSAGFDPVKVGGLDQAIRIEMFGDLHQFGGLDGKLVTVAEAQALLSESASV
ncbi:MAG: NAD(P)-binding domain-containing protein [Solirubrobacterales bacterium]|nr:NAD(P)-binding domain-containing protein [Solirubrobacterales bacterium]